MGCNSDYMASNNLEKNLSAVMNLIDEVITNVPVTKDYDNGYDPRIYNKGLTKGHLDVKTEELCSRLQTKSNEEISKYSLELQLWWRDHQEADAKRLKEELKIVSEKELALAKLSDYEKQLLGLPHSTT